MARLCSPLWASNRPRPLAPIAEQAVGVFGIPDYALYFLVRNLTRFSGPRAAQISIIPQPSQFVNGKSGQNENFFISQNITIIVMDA